MDECWSAFSNILTISYIVADFFIISTAITELALNSASSYLSVISSLFLIFVDSCMFAAVWATLLISFPVTIISSHIPYDSIHFHTQSQFSVFLEMGSAFNKTLEIQSKNECSHLNRGSKTTS